MDKSSNCYHCGLKVDDNNRIEAQIEDQVQDFCCIGCASVCQTIYGSGMGSFYAKQSDAILPAVELEYPLEFYDSTAFQQPFLEASDPQSKTITLISDTIHCAACIWLIEKSLSAIDGIVWVRANLTDKRIRISWNDEKVKLSRIMQKLADLGYAAMPYEQNLAEANANKRSKQMLYRIGFAAFTMMNMLLISVALYTGAADGKYNIYFQYLSFLLATPTLFYSGWGFLQSAYYGIKNGFMNMDVPISIGALTTYIYSTYVLLGFSTKSDVYFDTVVNFIFVILIGRYLEASSKKSALSASSSLQQLQPKVALVRADDKEIITPVSNIKIDDIVIIKPGERIAVDAQIVKGSTTIDESLLTGESVPVSKSVGDEVFAGSINTNGALEVKVTQLLRNSALSKIVDLVENTKSTKSSIVCTIDKVIPYFVWTTIALAIATFLFWYKQDFDLALLSGVSVLIITCPCAFGLATPMSIAVASGVAAKQKMLVKNGDAFEVLDKVKHVVFDKTGTLTLGVFKVDQIETSINPDEFIKITSSIERYSEHPLAKAIVNHNQDSDFYQVDDFVSTPGSGVKAKLDSQLIKVGNYAYMDFTDDKLYAKSQEFESKGGSCIWCANTKQILGFVVLSDQIKDDAIQTIDRLKQMGKSITMLTGDSNEVARFVSSKLGIENTISQVLPSDKAQHIKNLQQDGLTLMVGDGVNDAPALVQANTSIAIGSGSDVSAQHADVVVLKSTLSPVVDIIKLARNTQRTIKQNIVFALSYNAIMVPLAMMAKITPLFAAIVMPISSLIVIGNATRLKIKDDKIQELKK